MTVFARVVFALLVAATLSAFFLAQRLESAPPSLDGARVTEFFSPNGDGRLDAETISFRVKEAGDVTVDVVGGDGGRVRRLATAIAARPSRPVELTWDGRTDEGGRARDGRYRVRVALRRSGRSVVVPAPFVLDTTPPRPVVVRARPQGGREAGRGPAIVLPGQPVELTVRRVSPLRRTQFEVWRTDAGEPARVAAFEAPREGSGRGTWDGLVGGQPAPVGTYLVVPTVEDRAGNRGSAPAQLPPQPGEVPGRPGVTVRRLAVQPPLEPVRAGERARFLVDSRGATYRWNLRRVGGARRIRKGSGRPGRPLDLRAPGGRSGVYLLEVRNGRHATRVPFLVQSPERAEILAVLPAISWLGSDPVDDDGDGLPDTLALATSRVRFPRPLAGADGSGLPEGFATQTAPLLALLDRARVRYDVTTDLALAASRSDPSPTDREGVLLAGPHRWIPRALAGRLRRYAERGGRVASFGTEALRRGVTVARRRGRLERPTQPTQTDVFGARLRPLRRLEDAAPLVPLEDEPRLGLLEGTADRLGAFRVLEESVPEPGGRLRLLAGAGRDPGPDAGLDPATGEPERAVPALTASRLGRGVVIRVGLAEWGPRLGEDAGVQQVTRNVADILRRVRPRPRSPLR